MTTASTHPYATRRYAEGLAQGTGEAFELAEWSSFVLKRPIAPDPAKGPAGLHDAMGVYPMTPIQAQADLKGGLDRLANEGLVSVVLVPDPLASPDEGRLAVAFSLCRPFKTHYLVDPARGPFEPIKHHRDRIRRAGRRCRVETVGLADHLPVWTELYGGLVERRAISGAAAFGEAYFAALAREPRMVALAAYVEDRIAAMTIWFEHAGVAYNHLTASDAVGYANGANYALYDAAIAHFSGAAVFNLGGGAGAQDNQDDGLAMFKRGFANGETKALLCGAILDPARYSALAYGRPQTAFFPSYRA